MTVGTKMIKPEQIPDEALTAALMAYIDARKRPSLHGLGEPIIAAIILDEAIAAAINAWPRACRIDFDDWVEMVEGEIVLPASEKNDG